MDLTTLIDALVALLAAGSLGFLAYGGWLCVRHAARLDDATRHASGSQSLPEQENDRHRPIVLD